MRRRVLPLLMAASLTMLGQMVVLSFSVAAEGSSVVEMLERACSDVGGQFERFRTYRMTDITWSGGASCTTAEARLTCRENRCKAISLDRRQVALVKHKASPDLGQAVLPEHGTFERVLRGLAIY